MTIFDLVMVFNSSIHLSLFLWFSILVFIPANMSSISVAAGLSGTCSSSEYESASASSSSYVRLLCFYLLCLGSLLALCAAPTMNLNLRSNVSASLCKRASLACSSVSVSGAVCVLFLDVGCCSSA